MKCKQHRRMTVLGLAAFGVLLWSSTVAAAFDLFQDQPSVTEINQKQVTTTVKSGGLVEEFSFSIRDFKIDHQGENNNLNISIRYTYKPNLSTAEYPDFTLIAGDIEKLLTNYPNEDDYWEILNKKITAMVLEKYSAFAQITSTIQVSPSTKNHYLRSSIATRDRTIKRKRSVAAPARK